MPSTSGDKLVRRKAGQVPPMSPERAAEIAAIPDEAIDHSDIPEMAGGDRVHRDANGRFLMRPSPIREAVRAAMLRQELTAYGLWKKAREYSPTISETAIGEFLKGKRSIGLDYLEAVMAALDLRIVWFHQMPPLEATIVPATWIGIPRVSIDPGLTDE